MNLTTCHSLVFLGFYHQNKRTLAYYFHLDTLDPSIAEKLYKSVKKHAGSSFAKGFNPSQKVDTSDEISIGSAISHKESDSGKKDSPSANLFASQVAAYKIRQGLKSDNSDREDSTSDEASEEDIPKPKSHQYGKKKAAVGKKKETLFSDNESASELDDSSSEQEFTKPPKHVNSERGKKRHSTSWDPPVSKHKKKEKSEKDSLSELKHQKETSSSPNRALPPVPRKSKFVETVLSDSEASANNKK